jgi:hypothetical protein
MKVYLAKFTKNGYVAYKIGHTKWFNSIKRFDDKQYNIFDRIDILDDIDVQHANARTARYSAELIESVLHGIFPKNFLLEQHFNVDPHTFDGLSGITEMFLSDMPEPQIRQVFANVKYSVGRLLKDHSYGK